MCKFIFVNLFCFFGAFFLSAQCIQGDCQNGKGTFIYPSGAKYTGDFKNGEVHGIGVCYYTDGSKYSGEWQHRYPEGTGVKTFANGQKRIGKWRKGQPVDDAGNPIIDAIVSTNEPKNDGAALQSGCINGDCANGIGAFAYPDGTKYEGSFVENKPQGAGTFFYADGSQKSKYIGTFKGGLPNGKGTLFLTDSTEQTGDWTEGEYKGNPLAAKGQIGCISGDCINGIGVYIYKGGAARYEGPFRNGKAHGKGTIQYANGEHYVGQFADGYFNGEGTLHRTDSTKAEGIWDYGTYMGKKEAAKPAAIDTESDTLPQTQPVASTDTAKRDMVTEVSANRTMKIYALLVGVAAYEHMPALKYTDDDAYRMYAFLNSPGGGALPDDQLVILIDEAATKANILSAMDELFRRAGPDDLIMLYFSGHGLQGCFLPIDYDGFHNQLFHEEINEAFSRSKAKFKLCIADACHSGGLLALRDGETEALMDSYYRTLGQSQPGTALIMSSKSEENSLESKNLRQGVFSHFLLRGIKGEADKNGDHIVNITELYNFISDNVRDYTANKQSPVIKGTYDPKMTISVVR